MPHDLPITEFGLSPVAKDSCARLVLAGTKRATTSLLASYAYDREPVPSPGRRSVVRDGRGRDIAVIAVTRVEIRRYRDVDATYAALEGEGDKSLAHWQQAHWAYLGAECSRLGIPLSEDVEVVLEYFELVQPLLALADF
jgi:uncharacterized protein YhfF